MEKFTFIVSEDEAGLPLKKIIKAKYNFSSRLMTKIKYQDLLMLNGKKVPGYVVPSCGDTVTVSIPDEKSHFDPEDIPISIIYEDEDLLVINKQPGLTCHPTKGHPNHTLANAVMKHMLDNNQSYKIRFINRLDMDTSGVIMIGKNSFTQAQLIKQMDSNKTEKTYLALVHGVIDDERIKELTSLEGISMEEDQILIDLPIGHSGEGKISREVILDENAHGAYPSKTLFKVLDINHNKTLIQLKLLTGRTHQIRVHMSYLGHPLVGDELYGGSTELFSRQALHALSFACIHPVKKEPLIFEAPLPEDISLLLTKMVPSSSDL